MKGYLKSPEGLFQLAPKVTVIGKEGCDFVLQSNSVDNQHAVIEYSEQENCFILQDLNTAHGTYVNECLVKNAAVRLAPGDNIRFGFGGAAHEFQVESPQQYRFVATSTTNMQAQLTSSLTKITEEPSTSQPNQTQFAYPPVNQRTAWSQPITMITGDEPSSANNGNVTYRMEPLPHLSSMVKSTTSTYVNPGVAQPPPMANTVVPRPPTYSSMVRSRPLSAGPSGAQRRDERSQPAAIVGAPQRSVSAAGWVSVANSPTRNGTNFTTTAVQNNELMALQEKELKLMRLGEEVKRLAQYEGECNRKEDMIRTLREEIADLQQKIRRNETGHYNGVMTEADMMQKFMQMENEVTMKKMEIQSLKEQINQSRMQESRVGPVSQQDLNDRILEINSLRAELERVRKDKNITSGLVSQMQKDMISKDTTISRLSRDIDTLRNELQEKDIQLSSMQNTFKRVEENRRIDQDSDARDKELAALRHQFKNAESRVQDQSDLLANYKLELEKLRQEASDEKEKTKKILSDLEASESKSRDLERAERQVRVDLEQAAKRVERLKNRVVQVTFSTPGIKAPNEEISDDDLLETLKKIVDERTELMRNLQDAKENLRLANSSKKEMSDSAKKLKEQLNQSVQKLNENGWFCQSIKKETDLISCLSLDQSFTWMRDAFVGVLQSTCDWEGQIETALEQCKVNMKLSDEGPAKHILALKEKGLEVVRDKNKLIEEIQRMETQRKDDLDLALTLLQEEMENKHKDDIEKIKLDSDEKLNKAIDEVRALEAEKRDNGIEAEKNKVIELEASLEQLKQSMIESEAEQSVNKEAARDAFSLVDSLKSVESELREQIVILERAKLEESERSNKLIAQQSNQLESSVNSFKEQIKQHSVTICAMEERLNKVVKKNKDYQAEITQLKQTISEMRGKLATRPTPPPKPKMIVQKPMADVVAMEQLIIQLRREVADGKKAIQDEQNVVQRLRRDLAGAAAKLSDMTGELSESQKEEIERNKAKCREQEKQLIELRQNMAKLSQIVDKQATELKSYTSELGKHKTAASKYKNTLDERESTLKELQDKLQKESKDQQKQINLVQEEGRITSELSTIGAQCRGERHEQVIARQREALTELRSRIKDLEMTRPSSGTKPSYSGPSYVPNHDQALQQVSMLKNELSELRSSKALSDSRSAQVDASNTLQKQVSLARGGTGGRHPEADIERSAHRETLSALELSEASYLTLLRGVASTLELDDIAGLRSMAHIPPDERRRLSYDREAAVELVTSRIRVLKERIGRKDELLQGYELDLAKLRQAQILADTKHAQVESLSDDVRSRTEETQYLRESLHRTKEKLEQEKRLNSAIKTKKTFHVEGEKVTGTGPGVHRCNWNSPSQTAKTTAKRKVASEKLKRKEYEITILRGELQAKDRSLSDTRKKLYSMGGSMSSIDRHSTE